MKATKNVNQVARESKVLTAEQLRTWLAGKRVKIIGNTNSHTYGATGEVLTIGDDVYVSQSLGTGTSVGNIQFVNPANGYMGNNLKLTDLCFADENEEELNRQLESVEKEMSTLNANKSLILDKLNYLKETKKTSVESSEFIQYRLLNLLSSGKRKDKKVSEIYNLLK